MVEEYIDEELLCSDDAYRSNGTESGMDQFEPIIHTLESVILSDAFQDTVQNWCTKNCRSFFRASDDGSGGTVCSVDGEHKFEWTRLFEEYTTMIEDTIQEALSRDLPGVSFIDLEQFLLKDPDALAGDVFDILYTFGDYSEFISLMCGYAEQQLSQKNLSLGDDDAEAAFSASILSLAPSVVSLENED